jgi:cell division protein FtsL
VRGRLWVGFVGVLLAGIVFLNVSLLQLNQDIARTSTQATALDRHNSTLRMRLAALDSTERIQRLAAGRGMLMPAPGQYRYVRARPRHDGALAARRMTAPRPLTALAPPTQSAPTAAAGTSTAGTGSTGTSGATTPTAAQAAPTGATTGTATPAATTAATPVAGAATSP